jgi:hypothetical protein
LVVAEYGAEQAVAPLPHEMPAGADVTAPEPLAVTTRLPLEPLTGEKVADTVELDLRTTVQEGVEPLHPPPHLEKT